MMWAMPVAYLGPEGTFSEAALHAVDPAAEPLPRPTIQAALAAVRDGTAERAVVPIESSVEGVVTATLDDLAAGNDLVIAAELHIPIDASRRRRARRSCSTRSPAGRRRPSSTCR
jgi:prephenate dehydratase